MCNQETINSNGVYSTLKQIMCVQYKEGRIFEKLWRFFSDHPTVVKTPVSSRTFWQHQVTRNSQSLHDGLSTRPACLPEHPVNTLWQDVKAPSTGHVDTETWHPMMTVGPWGAINTCHQNTSCWTCVFIVYDKVCLGHSVTGTVRSSRTLCTRCTY